MATSRTHYFVSQNPPNGAIEHISSPDFNKLVNSAGRKNVEERSSLSSEISFVSSSESSSNLQYETSSEGCPPHNEDLVSRPRGNTIRNINRRHCPGATELAGQITGTEINHVNEANATSIPESVSTVETVQRSESVPFVRSNAGPCRTNDRIDPRQANTLVRLASESSPARMTKFKTIVDRVESIGWPRYDVNLSGQATSKDFSAVSDEMQTMAPRLIRTVHQPYRLFNDNRAVTIFPARSNIKPLEMSEKRTKLVSRIRSRDRPDLVTLSRIENELVPLQNEFSKLTGELRALDLTGLVPYNIDVEPWIDSSRGSPILSENASAYTLHHAKIFCRNDSLPVLTMTRRSRSFVLPLPAVDNITALPTTETSTVLKSCGTSQSSRIWHDQVQVDYRRSQNILRNSVERSRTFCRNSRHLGDDQAPFFNEKPLGYGFRSDCTVGRNDFADKPICFGITKGEREQDHLSLSRSSEQCSLLPLARNSHFRNTLSQFLDGSQNDSEARAMSEQRCTIASNGIDPFHGRCKELRDGDFCLTDDVSWTTRRNTHNLSIADACSDSFCATGKRAISRSIPDGNVSITRMLSDRSAASILSVDDICMTTNRHNKMQKTSSERISKPIEVKLRRQDETPEKSIVLTSKLENACILECDRSKDMAKYNRNKDNIFVATDQYNWQDIKVCQSMDILISQSFGGTIDSSNNVAYFGTKKTTSLQNCLQVSWPGSGNLRIHELNNSAISDNQLTDTYTKRMIVRKYRASPKVTNIAEQKAFASNGISVYPYGTETVEMTENCVEDVRSRQGAEKRLNLPIDDEKITIVPVMYAPDISKTIGKYDETFRHHKNIKIRADRYRSTFEKMTDRNEKSSARKSSMLSRDDSVALACLPSNTRHLRDKDPSFFGIEESLLDHGRTESRLSISYERSNASVSVSSSFGIERNVTKRQMVSKTKRKLFSRDNRSSFHKSSNCASAKSGRRRSNEEIIGIITSPDDFLDNA